MPQRSEKGSTHVIPWMGMFEIRGKQPFYRANPAPDRLRQRQGDTVEQVHAPIATLGQSCFQKTLFLDGH